MYVLMNENRALTSYCLKLNTTLVYDILYLLLYINYYCMYVYSTLLHILLLSTEFYTGFYYLLDFILENWWILSEMSKLDQKPVLDFHWILYWIIGGFLLNIKSTRFYVKSTRFPHLGRTHTAHNEQANEEHTTCVCPGNLTI